MLVYWFVGFTDCQRQAATVPVYVYVENNRRRFPELEAEVKANLTRAGWAPNSPYTEPLLHFQRHQVMELELIWLLAAFSALAFVDHFVFQLLVYRNPRMGRPNTWRWAEYSMSASLMNVVIVAMCGSSDLRVYLTVFVLTMLTMWFGYDAEFWSSASARANQLQQYTVLNSSEDSVVAAEGGVAMKEVSTGGSKSKSAAGSQWLVSTVSPPPPSAGNKRHVATTLETLRGSASARLDVMQRFYASVVTFLVGCVPFGLAWGVWILWPFALLVDADALWFVIAIMAVTLALECSFAVWQLVMLWASAMHTIAYDVGFAVLSLVAKNALVWILLGGIGSMSDECQV